jgi:hypothetical protein
MVKIANTAKFFGRLGSLLLSRKDIAQKRL